MRVKLGTGILALAAAGVVAACSSSEPEHRDAQSYCAARAEIECQVAPRCAGDVALCKRQRTDACLVEAQAAVATGRQFAPGNVRACLDAVEKVYSVGLVQVTDMGGRDSMADKCNRVFLGFAKLNEPCTTDYDCEQRRICAPTFPGSPQKVCADLREKREGEFCSEPGSVCTNGTYCSTEQGAPQCRKRKPRGTACAATHECDAALRCAETGFCEERFTSGQPCKTSDDCGPSAPWCDVTLSPMVCDAGRSFAPGSSGCIGYGIAAP